MNPVVFSFVEASSPGEEGYSTIDELAEPGDSPRKKKKGGQRSKSPDYKLLDPSDNENNDPENKDIIASSDKGWEELPFCRDERKSVHRQKGHFLSVAFFVCVFGPLVCQSLCL